MGVDYRTICQPPAPDELREQSAARLRRQFATPRPLPPVALAETLPRHGKPPLAGDMSMAVVLDLLREVRADNPGMTLTEAAKLCGAETGVNHKTIIKWAWKARQP